LDWLAGHTGKPIDLAPAKWIWNDAGAAVGAPVGALHFRKIFTLRERPRQARIVITADNRFSLYLNGKPAGNGRNYAAPLLLDVTEHLQSGENLLAVTAHNDAPEAPKADKNKANGASAASKAKNSGETAKQENNPAGFWAYLRVTTSAGELVIGTDATWMCSAKATAGWEKGTPHPDGWRIAVALDEAEAKPWSMGRALAGQVARMDQLGRVRASLANADPLAVALGRPNREQVNTTRPSVATTLQALELTNGKTLAEVLRRGAEGLLAGSLVSGDALVDRIYRTALARPPTAREEKLALQLVGKPASKEGIEDFLWAMLMSPEFQLIY
jgi:hypothetical protein